MLVKYYFKDYSNLNQIQKIIFDVQQQILKLYYLLIDFLYFINDILFLAISSI